MRDVYHNAAFCIAATAAHNSANGLFYGRNEYPHFMLESSMEHKSSRELGSTVYLPPGTYTCSICPRNAQDVIESSPLNRRAWVAQERHLSRRIMHFTHVGLSWECFCSFTCETHSESQICSCHSGIDTGLKRVINDIKTKRSSTWTTSDSRKRCNHRALIMFRKITNHKRLNDGRENKQPVNLNISHDKKQSLYRAWYDFRELYTQCGLTKESDILVALRGVALDVCELLHDRLVFGLWQGRLLEELNWTCRVSGANPGEVDPHPGVHRAGTGRAQRAKLTTRSFRAICPEPTL
jgi:hypothetical protein